ncbi:hypothetical protein M0813_24102 [Anaeramoeba flamelloides]|uniref:C2H2-type domain-containing protein n=1 Tax=Anaeramoeba flamelloides TaxID=1746091 RepID=A0ABQ8Y9I0_9EUKA|nr:hypothetical protein M0813_24102 [Anaeramoeba flamelloides]
MWHGKYHSICSYVYHEKKYGGVINLPNQTKIKKEKLSICNYCYKHWNNWNVYLQNKRKEKVVKEKEKKKEKEKEKTKKKKNSSSSSSPHSGDTEIDEPYVYSTESENENENDNKSKSSQHQKEQNVKENKTHTQKAFRTLSYSHEEYKLFLESLKENEYLNIIPKFDQNDSTTLELNNSHIIRTKSLEIGKESLLPKPFNEMNYPHSNYMIDSKQMHYILNNLLCKCGKKQELIEIISFKGSNKAKLKCKECGENIINFSNNIKTLSKKKDKKKNKKQSTNFKQEIGQRKVIASILAGNFYEQYRSMMESLGLNYIRRTAYNNTLDVLIKKSHQLFKEHLRQNRKDMDLKNLTIRIDAGWSSRGYHARECVFVIVDDKTGKIFDLVVITRKDNYNDSSVMMEADAAKIFCKRHMGNITIVNVIKDGDTKLGSIFKSTWKEVELLADRNHLFKNMRKNLGNIKDFPFLKNIRISFTNWVRTCLVKSRNSLELHIRILLSLFHFIDDHEYCNHKKSKIKNKYQFSPLNTKDYIHLKSYKKKIMALIRNLFGRFENTKDELTEKYYVEKNDKIKIQIGKEIEIISNKIKEFKDLKRKLLENLDKKGKSQKNEKYFEISPQLLKLEEIISEVGKFSHKIFTSGSTNICESFMNSRTKFIPKRINAPKQWRMRCEFSIFEREKSNWRSQLMRDCGFKIGLPQLISECQKNQQREQEKIVKNSNKYKKRKIELLKEKLKNRKGSNQIGAHGSKLTPKQLQKKLCRWCNRVYSYELNRLLHEIIYHKKIPLDEEEDMLFDNISKTKKLISSFRNSVQNAIKRIKKKINSSKYNSNLHEKEEILKKILQYQEEFNQQIQERSKKKVGFPLKKRKINQKNISNTIEIEIEIENEDDEKIGEEVDDEQLQEIMEEENDDDDEMSFFEDFGNQENIDQKIERMYSIKFSEEFPENF